jgi:hypothetical protein
MSLRVMKTACPAAPLRSPTPMLMTVPTHKTVLGRLVESSDSRSALSRLSGLSSWPSCKQHLGGREQAQCGKPAGKVRTDTQLLEEQPGRRCSEPA